MKEDKKIGMYIRFFLTAVLLVVVWFNSHWSVALVLTLMTTALEVQLYNQQLQEKE